jgi:hypothetical protein
MDKNKTLDSTACIEYKESVIHITLPRKEAIDLIKMLQGLQRKIQEMVK